ncbi:BLUF domain-containing protein [Methylophilus sp. YYY-1]|uniref:BLUF domain-containing protein n=1 Tax=Methylophilus sp. YYY-1 TaxID=2682087 RepID=UPI0023B23A86|nr:BLUF domain-containing protein [Methylophilus sp. YYY-1]
MKFVLYTSVLNQEHYDVLVVPEIVKTARAANSRDGITGVLLFDGLNFTQYFEGEAASVDALLANILRDRRHKNIVMILSGDLPGRLYADWGMGYIDISDNQFDMAACLAAADFSVGSFKQKMSQLDVE